MRAMKDSGIEWIGEIPQDWVVGKISYFVKIYTGNSISDSEKDNYAIEDGIPYISTKDIDVVSAKANYENGLNVPYDSTFKTAPTGTTLLCIEGGSAGKKIAYIDREVAFVNKLCAFVSDNINKKYLYYYIFSDAFVAPFNLNITGLIGGVSQSLLNKFSLIIPLQKDQERIANFLDNKCEKIDRLIALQEEMIEELKAYKQSVITEAVTKGLDPTVPMKDSGIEWIGKIPYEWEISTVLKNINFEGGSQPPLSQFIDDEKEGYIRLIQNRDYRTDNYKVYVPINSVTKFCDENDVMIGRYGPPLFVIHRGLAGAYNVAMMKAIPINIDRQYMYYYLHNSTMLNYIISFSLRSAGQSGVNPQILKSYPMMIPNILEQQQIANYLDKKCADIDNLISIKQSKIDELKDYKKSLIYEYVTGKKEVI